jgi:hypothetical protein
MINLSISLNYKTKAIAFLFLISTSTLINCQVKLENCTNNVQDTSIYEENIAAEPVIELPIYQGQNFFNEDWTRGTIITMNGEKIYNKLINYHLMSHKLVWQRDLDKGLMFVKKEIVKEFILSSDSVEKSIYRKIKIQLWDKPDSVEEYLQVLSKGYINLYAYRKSVLGQKTQKLFRNDDYYIQVNNGNIKRLKLFRKFLYTAVNENNDFMKKIVRSNHLRIRKEKGLIKAIDIFNREIINTKN